MKKILITSIFILSLLAFNLRPSKSTYLQTYNWTLSKYFAQLDSINNQYFILSDSLNHIIEIDQIKLVHLNEYDASLKIKKGKIRELYYVTTDIRGDTIDFNIGGWDVEYKRSLFKKNQFRYGAWCAGTSGQPSVRIIYSWRKNKWNYFSQSDLMNIENNTR